MNQVETEKWRRIRLSVAAYAYEVLSISLMTDHEFDHECRLVNLKIKTGNDEMDKWFIENFSPHTGSWVNRHPYKKRLDEMARDLAGSRGIYIE